MYPGVVDAMGGTSAVSARKVVMRWDESAVLEVP